jgi:hypothetical protein
MKTHVCVDAALRYRFAAEDFECDPTRVPIIATASLNMTL